MTLKTLRTLKNWRQSDAAAAVNVSVDDIIFLSNIAV